MPLFRYGITRTRVEGASCAPFFHCWPLQAPACDEVAHAQLRHCCWREVIQQKWASLQMHSCTHLVRRVHCS
jgi:hypothetical protein